MTGTYMKKTDADEFREERFFPDMRKSRFGERLKFAMKGIANTRLADMCGIGESTIRSYLAEKTTPTLTILGEISAALDVPATWLLSGEPLDKDQHPGEVAPGIASTNLPKRTELDDDFVTVNDFSNVEAAAGGGAYITNEETTGRMAFRREWIDREGLKAQALRVIRARGDSMEPTIQDGAPILVEAFAYEDDQGNVRYLYSSNTPREVVKRDGVYVVRLDDKLLVKRLQLDMLGGLYVMSDNQTYKTLHIPAKQLEEIAVIGRVVWTGRKL